MSALRAVALAAAMLAGAVPAASAASAWRPRPPGVAVRATAPARFEHATRPSTAPRPAFARRWGGGRRSLAGICTPIGPCVGPDGSVYCVTPSGQLVYLPR